MEGDSGTLKGYWARNTAVSDAAGIAQDMGLEFVRTLTASDLMEMAGNQLDREIGRSFRRADLVIEATRGGTPQYVALEVSYTADQRDSGRALRNAGILTRFTGRKATASVASVRNTHEVEQLVESGELYWHPLEDRARPPSEQNLMTLMARSSPGIFDLAVSLAISPGNFLIGGSVMAQVSVPR